MDNHAAVLDAKVMAAHRQAVRRRVFGQTVLFAIVVAIVAIIVFPYYWMLSSSLQGKSVFQWPPEIFPSTVSLNAYSSVLEKRPIAQWFRNTGIVALTSALFALAVSINAAYSLSRFRNRLNNLFGILILVTQMLPATLLVIPFYMIFRELGLLDKLPGLIVADTTFALPLAIWIMKGFFDSIPTDLEEQAMIDGCTRYGAFYRVVLPLTLPGLVVVAVFAFMVGWDEFFFARTLINSQEWWVLSVGLTSFQGEYTVAWNEMMAAAVIFTIPAALFFLLAQRYLVQGLTGGAVKG